MANLFRQCFFIPAPTLTEKNLADQAGIITIITGAYAGCGLELTKLLYAKNATIYVAGRSEEKASQSIATVKRLFPESKGRLEFLKVDLSDLATIKPAVEEFLSKEKALHVLTNNAGVMLPPQGSKDAHGHELQLGTNCLGPFLFTKLLTPLLIETAKTAPTGSVRVTWASSIAAPASGPTGGISFEQDGTVTQYMNNSRVAYAQSKSANCLLAAEYSKRYAQDGIISVSWNPGNLKTDLSRHLNSWAAWLIGMMIYPPVYGGYTELYAGWSPEITAEHGGKFVAPWGRVLSLRQDIEQGMQRTSEGGTGHAERFWTYCDKETATYA